MSPISDICRRSCDSDFDADEHETWFFWLEQLAVTDVEKCRQVFELKLENLQLTISL